MSLLIATPCYGGMATLPYLRSLLETQEDLLRAGVDFDLLLTDKESLITRARNTSATRFLETPFRKLLFIDSDLEFSPRDVAALWNHDLPIVGASYPWKKLGAVTTVWKDSRMVPLDNLEGLTQVDFLGTGFLMIDRGVLEELQGHVQDFDEAGRCWNFFGTYVTQGETWKDRCFLSEDYAFCQRAKDRGYKIIVDPSIRLIHHGTHGFGD